MKSTSESSQLLPQQGGEQTPHADDAINAFREYASGELWEGLSYAYQSREEGFLAGWDAHKSIRGEAVLPQVGEATPIRFCRPRDGSVLWLELSPNMAEFDPKYELDNHEYRTLYNAPQKEQKPIRWVTAADYDWLLKNPDVGSASMTLLNKGGGKRVALLAAPATLGEAKAVAPADLVGRLCIHAADKNNTAFARSTMRELIEYFAAPVAEALPVAAETTKALINALDVALRQNEHDMLMTGEELRAGRAVLAAAMQGEEA